MEQSSEHKGIRNFAIVKILKSFSEVEINEFGKFLNSPFFNNHSTVTRLYGELVKFHPDYPDKSVSRQKLFNVASNGKKFDDQLMRKYLSRLTKFAEEYLSIVQMRKEKDKKEFNILVQLSQRNLKDAYSRKLKSLEEFYKREQNIDHDYFLTRHQMSTLKHNLKSLENNVAMNADDIHDSFDYLLNYFLFQSVNMIAYLQTDIFTFRINENTDLLQLLIDKLNIEEFMKEIRSITPPQNTSTLAFLNILLNDFNLTSAKSNMTVYKNLKKLVYENSEKFSKSILQYYLKRLIIFCVIENAKGKNDMNKEIFENYKMLTEKNLFDIDGTKELTLLDFRLILSSSLKAGEFDWAKKFISKNLGMVKDEVRNNIFNYAHACLSFHEERYTEALDYVSMIEFESMPLTIDIYVIKSKIFYLLGHTDSAFSVVDSFRHYIKSNKMMSDIQKEALLNFLRYFRKILRYSKSHDKLRLKKLLLDLGSASITTERKWMISIVSGLLSES